MGKGDKKTKRGKINRGSYGVLRPRGKKVAVVTKPKKVKPKKAAAKPATKPAAKKTTKAATKTTTKAASKTAKATEDTKDAIVDETKG